ncbi:NAD(P)H:quinone oxidoreductase [Anaerococcus sp. AGMB09787]|uniref:NAD(P)H:quinone oxidoreductase n=1 Tax=Anaerococcus sp. AGMB09787 TaxID=2922869 RepID=UPI001FAE9427|nr:NAD(P)H:quinone oxidoreductase [Anaerococcus sp. AGMB09787]
MSKLTIVYYSQTGVNLKMAKLAAKTAQEYGAEVRLRRVKELRDTSNVTADSPWAKKIEAEKDIEIATPEDLVWADAIIISSPTRFGNIASQMKNFIDSLGAVWSKGQLVNKYVTAFSSSQNANGGQESTIKTIYTSAMHWGSIIVPTGFTDDSIYAQGGNPYGVSATQKDNDDIIENDVENAIIHQTKRLLDVASN